MTIKVINKDIYVDQYDHGVDIEFNLVNDDDTPFDLSEYSIQIIVKDKRNDKDEDAIVNILTSGELVFPISKELTSNSIGIYYYAVRLYKGDIFANTIIQGNLHIVDNTFESGVV